MSAIPTTGPQNGLKIVADDAPAPYCAIYMEQLQERLNVFRDRFASQKGYRRLGTKAEARAALESLAEVAACIALSLPHEKGEMFSSLMDAFDAIVGSPR